MDGMYSTSLALRAIIAVFLERTLGRGLMVAVLLTAFIAGLALYNALNGMTLSWIIFSLSVALLVFLLLFTAVAFFAVFKLLPRKLTRGEKRRIAAFTKTLKGRLELARTPIPLLVFQLAVQALINQRESDERRHLRATIDKSHSLSHDFTVIRGYFEK